MRVIRSQVAGGLPLTGILIFSSISRGLAHLALKVARSPAMKPDPPSGRPLWFTESPCRRVDAQQHHRRVKPGDAIDIVDAAVRAGRQALEPRDAVDAVQARPRADQLAIDGAMDRIGLDPRNHPLDPVPAREAGEPLPDQQWIGDRLGRHVGDIHLRVAWILSGRTGDDRAAGEHEAGRHGNTGVHSSASAAPPPAGDSSASAGSSRSRKSSFAPPSSACGSRTRVSWKR